MSLSDRYFRARAARGRTRLQLDKLEERCTPAGVRTIDGSGNNVANPAWGTPNQAFLRTAPIAYGDGLSSPAGANRPSARTVSNAVAAETGERISSGGLSAMTYAWGQFLDHDLDLTNTASPTESFNIPVPAGDPYFDPFNTGTQTIPLSRSAYASQPGPRQQVNSITAWIDGSQIYGSDVATANGLRTFSGGRLKTSGGNMLPFDPSIPGFYLAGDIRVNENVELIALQTLWVREHNRVAVGMQQANPGWTDEQVYQQARAFVIAELQVITYREWLPAVVGQNGVRPYQGYRAQVNPGIANEFSTAAFRLGHSMLGDDVEFLDNNGLPVRPGVSLAEAFFNPQLIASTGIDSVIKYLASDPSSEIDTQIVDSVRNFLFGPPGAGGLDLASLNIQRGRDHGLADYNSIRSAYGLPRVNSFAQITSDPVLQQKLQQLYGTVNNIDAWVGGLAEDHVPGANVGPLFQRVIGTQFERLRDGDRFWYQMNGFTTQQLQELDNTRLADVIRRNTAVSNIQNDSFFFRVAITGTAFNDTNRDGIRQPGEAPIAGRTIRLIDLNDNSIVETVVTRPDGSYDFDTADDLRTGRYRVQEVLPIGWVETKAPPSVLAITRGSVTLNGNHFGSYQKVVLPPLLSPPLTEWYDNSTGDETEAITSFGLQFGVVP